MSNQADVPHDVRRACEEHVLESSTLVHEPEVTERRHRPAPRRPLRSTASPLATSSGVREMYSGSHPQRRHRHRHRHTPNDN
ncbi:jg17374 [Pararge aegeria aegeria]|uniref:Jg17374 protein n=1 Tax=Pararge aegeria aegeria TaxID=348720 RepID=A0A8S4RXF4_9NEOP|nr:jg17374 [Pararge aegeria aegeria]